MLRLLDLREDKDLKGSAVAKILNISQSQYSRIELEESKITHDKLIILAKFYNTNIDYLLGITNEIKPYKIIEREKYINNLKKLRKEKKLKEKNVADILELSQQHYSSLEANEYKITHDKLKKLALFYNTSIDYLIGLTEDFKYYPRIKTKK